MYFALRSHPIRKHILTLIAIVSYLLFSICAFISNHNSTDEQLYDVENQTPLPSPNFWGALFESNYKKNSIASKAGSLMELSQLARLDSIDQNCQKIKSRSRHDLDRTKPTPRFYVDERHQLLFCYIPEVASRNLKQLVLMLSGTVDSSVIRDITRFESSMRNVTFLKTEDLKGVDNYKKFVFVRHPFERLVSAYYSKFIATEEKTKYQLTIGTKIIKKYRQNATVLSLKKGHDVTVPEFVSYVIDEWATRAKKPVDEHWRSQVDLCRPCSNKFDFVGKFETMQQDFIYLLQTLEEDELIEYFKSIESSSTSPLVKQFLKQLTYQQLIGLFQVYENDFKVFGYAPNVKIPMRSKI